MNQKIVRITENELKWIVEESVNRILSEGIMTGVMRRAYNSGRYDNDNDNYKSSFEDFTDYIKGNSYADDESYDDWKKEYEKYKASEKERYGDKPNEKVGRGGYSNWTNKARAQDSTDSNATNALMSKPGIKGKLTRAAALPLAGASRGAGKLMRKIKRD